MMNGLIQLLNNFGISEGIILNILFYSIAAATIAFALLVVISRNIFHSALYLALVLIGVACIYLYLDAEFLAIVQILIYVGAIMTLFLFTIMLTSDIYKKTTHLINWRMAASAVAALAGLGIFITIIRMNPWQAAFVSNPPIALPELGRELLVKYGLAFEVISILSLAALVGAIFIGKAKRE